MARASGQQKAAARPRKRASGRSAAAPWGPTELQRDYRTLLDRAKHSPQELLDSDGELLVIQDKQIAEFQRALRDQVAETARFLAVYQEHRDVPAERWAAQTAYPWLAALGAEEIAEFATELLAETLQAAQRGALDRLQGSLVAWASTASLYADPSQLRALLAPVHAATLVEVFPPSERQVRAAPA